MAYDWSGNNVRQQRYDRVVVAAIAALVLMISLVPLALRSGETHKSNALQLTSADHALHPVRM